MYALGRYKQRKDFFFVKLRILKISSFANIIIKHGHSDLSYRKTFGLIGTGLTKNAFITNLVPCLL